MGKILNFQEWLNEKVYFTERDELFQTYQGRYMFDITKAYELIKQGKLDYKIKEYKISHLAHFAHEHFVTIDREHLKISKLDIDNPIGLLVKIKDPETKEEEWILIDGNHRITKAKEEHHEKGKVYQIDDPNETAKFVNFDLKIPKKYYVDDDEE